jgi:iron(III) transport system substrate-binding protein
MEMKSLWASAAIFAYAVLLAQTPTHADDEFADLAAKAKTEGEVTWYTAHFDNAVTGKIGAAFTAKYPGIKVNVLKSTAQVNYQRLLQDIGAGVMQADVFSSTDASQFLQLAQDKALEAYEPKNEAKIVPAFRNIDPFGFYHVTAVSLVAITYNNQKLTEAEIPKTWQELLDPKWSNKVALGDPNFSGMVGAWAVTLQKMYGWDYFTRLSAGKPLITRSIDDTVTILNSGERELAAGDPASTLRSTAKGNPLSVVYPTDGVIAVVEPSAIVAGAKHPNAARLFMEFLLSTDCAKIEADAFEQSLRPEVAPSGAKPLDQIKINRVVTEDVASNLKGVRDKWRDTFTK